MNYQLVDIIQTALNNMKSNLHTSTIGRVVKVDATTIDIQPVINRQVEGKDIKLPIFTKVPPLFMHGGGSYTAHPIAVGDYALLIFTERSFDNWYNGADEVLPKQQRTHHYSDAVAIVGLYNKLGAITIPSVITEIGDKHITGNVEHIGNLDITGNITVSGSITVTGGDIVADGISLKSHIHGGVASGTSKTSIPE